MRQFVRPEIDSRAALVTLMDARGALYQLRVSKFRLHRENTCNLPYAQAVACRAAAAAAWPRLQEQSYMQAK